MCNFRDHFGPVAGARLGEQAHGWIPVASSPLRGPAPVRLMLEQQPGRAAQRPGQVGDHRVDGDDQRGAGDQPGRLHQVERATLGVQDGQRRGRRIERDASAAVTQGSEELGRDRPCLVPVACQAADRDGAPGQPGRERSQVRRRKDGRLRPQRAAQLHDLDVALGRSVGPALIERDQAIGRGVVAQQRDQPWLNLQRERAGAAAQLGQEAEELDGVAKPVVAAHQHIAAVEGPPVPNPAQMVGQAGIVAAFAAEIARRRWRSASCQARSYSARRMVRAHRVKSCAILFESEPRAMVPRLLWF